MYLDESSSLGGFMESDCLNKCAAYYVCSSSIRLYSAKCMQYLKVMDSKGLGGSGNKLESSSNSDYTKMPECHLKDKCIYKQCGKWCEHFA